MEIFGQTNIGLVRATNQDSFRIGKFPGGSAWAVVCDGMGGASGGDVASKMAADLIAERIEKNYHDDMKQLSVSNLLESAINFANISQIALNSGYKKAYSVSSEAELLEILPEFINDKTTSLLEIKVKCGAREDLGRPKEKPAENKALFMEHLND